MTVRELIDLLSVEDQDRVVWLDSGHHIGHVRSLRRSRSWGVDILWLTGQEAA